MTYGIGIIKEKYYDNFFSLVSTIVTYYLYIDYQ